MQFYYFNFFLKHYYDECSSNLVKIEAFNDIYYDHL